MANEGGISSSWTGEARGGQRLSKADIEQRLLSTAKTLIEGHGLTVSLTHLRLDELMDLAGVPKTSFYRVWGSKDAFFTRLLEELVQLDGGVAGSYDPQTLEVSRAVVMKHQDMLGDAEGRRRVLTEAIRQGAERNFVAIRGSKRWQNYIAILATVPGIADEDTRERLVAALRAAEAYFLGQMAAFYEEVLPLFRYRLREGVTASHVAAVGAAVVEGLVQRSVVSPELVDGPIPGPAIDGGTTDWHPAAIGFLGVVQALIEPIEDDPSADST